MVLVLFFTMIEDEEEEDALLFGLDEEEIEGRELFEGLLFTVEEGPALPFDNRNWVDDVDGTFFLRTGFLVETETGLFFDFGVVGLLTGDFPIILLPLNILFFEL